jgi:hypothetical protein
MVLNQPAMSKAQWQAEVNKMRTAYKAPIDPKDVGAIVNYLAALRSSQIRIEVALLNAILQNGPAAPELRGRLMASALLRALHSHRSTRGSKTRKHVRA